MCIIQWDPSIVCIIQWNPSILDILVPERSSLTTECPHLEVADVLRQSTANNLVLVVGSSQFRCLG